MRQINTHETDRIESGPVQFCYIGPGDQGDDWPGVFLRGADCIRLRFELQRAIDQTTSMFDRQMMPELLNHINQATSSHQPDPVQPDIIPPTGKIHTLKILQPFFQAVLEGRKTFEVRRIDRGFTVGDSLLLRETTDPDNQETGGQLLCSISYILPGGQYGIDPDWCVLGIVGIPTNQP